MTKLTFAAILIVALLTFTAVMTLTLLAHGETAFAKETGSAGVGAAIGLGFFCLIFSGAKE